ncbi:ATP-NAD kinase family protein [Paeniglutamicibacter kerguelensis]|uniref:Polyphosphate/ATP-dependent NAD kinase n=1 Tax=Paeniglutamicibacter kerguelensis TaxID=254788 RepID=A0ABS4XH47_9MICC|nr:ATP-NAD kinase family protein [Paeniglutamicibacter kerguelensis]MBP2387799.1 putative polyphosphate/ATP-dependent NAD kinase [Paeniglutamicibacter kerguelensis]
MDVTIGLIVNPVAGLGGRMAHKGSDASNIRDLAKRAGIEPLAPERAGQAVRRLLDGLESSPVAVRILAGADEMGADALDVGIPHKIIASGAIHPGASSSEDTKSIARNMAAAGVDLLLFAGGDGTARDILDAIGSSIPVLGIPAGVKIYSGVFGLTPSETGALAAGWLANPNRCSDEREVVDIDEDELRQGLATPSLYGTLRVPSDSRRLQPRKSGSPASDINAARSLGMAFAATMVPDRHYVLGPGSTTMAIGSALDLELTRLGVDVVCNGQLIAEDVDADTLNAMVPAEGATIVVTPLGQQGFVIGRGNQQIDYRVLQRSELKIVATPSKMISLGGRPLWVDSGHPELDATICGYTKVFTGAKAEVIYPISNTADAQVRA